jgi:hypothetical protein
VNCQNSSEISKFDTNVLNKFLKIDLVKIYSTRSILDRRIVKSSKIKRNKKLDFFKNPLTESTKKGGFFKPAKKRLKHYFN